MGRRIGSSGRRLWARVEARPATESGEDEGLSLERNFLHAAALEFAHPRTGETLSLEAELPEELGDLLEQLRGAEG